MVETFFTEKRIIKKIIIVLLFIFVFNFTFSYLGNNVVFAEEDGTTKVTEDYEAKERGRKIITSNTFVDSIFGRCSLGINAK